MQIFYDYLRGAPVGFLAGVRVGAYCFRSSVRKLQEDNVVVFGLCGILVDGIIDGQGEIVTKHPVTPDDMCLRIIMAKHFQEVDDGFLEAVQVIFLESAVLIQTLFKSSSCDRI